MKSLIGRIQKQYNKKIKFWRIDNAKKFINDLFQNLLKRNHIEWEHISPYTYYQSSIIERVIQIIIDKIRILIIEIQLSIYLWIKLVKITVYLKNRFPIKSLLDTTP
jgi:transposase InsO family protein